VVTRRNFVLASLAVPLAGLLAGPRARSLSVPGFGAVAMPLCLHQNTSRAAGFRGSLEGWARAGIRHVELNDALLDRFVAAESLSAARSLLDDLGLVPVSGATLLQDIWLPGPARAASLETWRRRCAEYAELGLPRIYAPSITTRPVTADDLAATPACIREVGDIASSSGLTAMIEFTRTSTHLSTLAATLLMIRRAAHPGVRPMLDLFHFWSGASRMEELDLLLPGELAHVHFQDTADEPADQITYGSRRIPGDGVAPLVELLRKLDEKDYTGALSVELIQGAVVRTDPFEAASEIRQKSERVMGAAGVLSA